MTSPFLSEYELDAFLPSARPEDALLAELLDELHDEEFDRAVDRLTIETRARAQARHGGLIEGELDWRGERLLTEELAPLATAAEQLLETMAQQVSGLDLQRVTEAELDDALAHTLPRSSQPVFEQFLSSLWKKAKQVAKGAANLAKKGIAAAATLGLGPILAKLKALVRPLLDKVIALALDKIPEPYRSMAKALKQGGLPTSPAALVKTAIAASPLSGIAKLQQVASAVAPVLSGVTNGVSAAASSLSALAPTTAPAAGRAPATPPEDEPVPDEGVATVSEPAAADVGDVQEELDNRVAELMFADPTVAEELPSAWAAGATFAADPLTSLDAARQRFVRELEHEDPQPAVEHFLPVLLGALRLGIRLAGRPRVVRFLGDLIGKLVRPVSTPQLAPKLGAAIADVGLRTFLQAETADEDPAALTREAITHTVEETVRTLTTLPDSAFEHEAVFESHALEAFENAAANHFPAHLLKPEHRTVEAGIWVPVPRRGRRYYKKYSQRFDVVITPDLARSVRVFGGTTLATYLRDRLGLSPTANVRARIHLYEMLPGGRHGHIALGEKNRGELHPLGPAAAATLLQRPQLGREVAGTPDPLRPRLGERLYALELEQRPLTVGEVSHLHLSLHPARGALKACIYLSEAVSQRVAASLRKRARVAASLHEIRQAVAGQQRLRVAHQGLPTPLTRAARHALAHRLASWIWAPLADHLERAASEVIAATEHPDPGITLCIQLDGIPPLRSLLAPATAGPRAAAAGVFSHATVRVAPGYHP